MNDNITNKYFQNYLRGKTTSKLVVFLLKLTLYKKYKVHWEEGDSMEK